MGRSKTTTRNSKTAPARIADALREQMSMALRMQGGSYEQIAKQMRTQQGVKPSYNKRDACQDVMNGLSRLNKECDETADELRRLELERIDVMWASVWPFAQQGDTAYIGLALKLQDQRAKYLPLQTASGAEKAGPRGASMSVTETSTSGGTLRITEVEVELRGVSTPSLPAPDESTMIDVTPVASQ